MKKPRNGDIQLLTQAHPCMRFSVKLSKMGDDYYLRVPTRLRDVAAKIYDKEENVKVTVTELWESEEMVHGIIGMNERDKEIMDIIKSQIDRETTEKVKPFRSREEEDAVKK